MSPEQRLWCAVIIRTIDDARDICRAIKNDYEKYGHAFYNQKQHLNLIENAVKSEWFRSICNEFTELHIDKVKAALATMYKENKINEIKYVSGGKFRYLFIYE